MLTSSVTAVQFYFNKKRPIANGITTGGSGVGSMIIPLVFDSLITLYTWRGTTLVYGGLILNGLVFGALFRPHEMEQKSYSMSEPKQDEKYQVDNSSSNSKPQTRLICTLLNSLTSLCDCSLFTNGAFVVYIIGYFLLMTGYEAVYSFLPDKATENGIDRSKASLLITVSGATGLCHFILRAKYLQTF